MKLPALLANILHTQPAPVVTEPKIASVRVLPLPGSTGPKTVAAPKTADGRTLADITKSVAKRDPALWQARAARRKSAFAPASRALGINEYLAGYVSPHSRQKIQGLHAIVTQIKLSKVTPPKSPNFGFYAESEGRGFYVYTKQDPRTIQGFQIGAEVDIAGIVAPFKGGDERDASNLQAPQISSFIDQLSVINPGTVHPLSDPVIIGKNGKVPPAKVISDETAAIMAQLKTDNVEHPDVPYLPERDALAFYHSLIGSRVKLQNAVVVGASDDRKYFYVVPDNGERILTPTGRGGETYTADNFPTDIIKVDVAGLTAEQKLVVKVGDKITTDLVGTMEYSFGNFQVRLSEPFQVARGDLKPNFITFENGSRPKFVFGGANVENLSVSDAVRMNTLAFNAVVYQRLPDFIGWNEIQDDSSEKDDGTVSSSKTTDLFIDKIVSLHKKIMSGDTAEVVLRLKADGFDDAEIPAMIEQLKKTLPKKIDLEAVTIDPINNSDGGQPGGNIRVVALVNKAVANFARKGDAGAQTQSEIVTGPDGKPHLNFNPVRVDAQNEAFAGSRKPLAVEVEVGGETYFVIVNHYISKRGDSNPWGIFQPTHLPSEDRRAKQTGATAELVKNILAKDKNANIIVMGDMNDFHFRKPLEVFAQDKILAHLPSAFLKGAEIYSYVHNGVSQALDQMFASAALLANMAGFSYAHVNAEWPSVRESTGPTQPDSGGRSTDPHGRHPNKPLVMLRGETATVMPSRTQSSDHDAYIGWVK